MILFNCRRTFVLPDDGVIEHRNRKLLKIKKMKYIADCMNLLEDAKNPNNSFGISMAYSDLKHRILFCVERNKEFDLAEFISFKKEWYFQLKNNSLSSSI